MAADPKLVRASKDIRRKVVDKTGFTPEDLLDAPLKRPELKNTAPSIRPEQLVVVIVGFVFAVIGLVLTLAYLSWVGVLLMVAGAAAIAVASLVRI